MLFPGHLVVVRGGGDLGTGAVVRLARSGFPVVVLELATPLAIRRSVAVSSAVEEGEVTVEDVTARRVTSPDAALEVAHAGAVAVLVAPQLPDGLGPVAVVDARMAKRNLDTTIDQAPLVVALGPGFTAGLDCHAVVETMRGPRLGRVLWEGAAAADTGVPGVLGGASVARVIRAGRPGTVTWAVAIGDRVAAGQHLGDIGGAPIGATIGGVVRGLIVDGYAVTVGMKVADIDPRGEPATCFSISDKALAVGGGVLEAVLTRLNRTS